MVANEEAAHEIIINGKKEKISLGLSHPHTISETARAIAEKQIYVQHGADQAV